MFLFQLPMGPKLPKQVATLGMSRYTQMIHLGIIKLVNVLSYVVCTIYGIVHFICTIYYCRTFLCSPSLTPPPHKHWDVSGDLVSEMLSCHGIVVVSIATDRWLFGACDYMSVIVYIMNLHPGRIICSNSHHPIRKYSILSQVIYSLFHCVNCDHVYL